MKGLREFFWAGLVVCVLARIPAIEAGPRDVILLDMTIFQTHELLGDPTIYFKCSNNKTKTYLPEISDDNELYAFTGLESFQPLTTLPTDQCKFCGFYAEHWLFEDSIFAEWELCPLDFAANGTYEKFVRHELDAILYCQQCSGVQAPAPAPAQVPIVLTPTAVPTSLAGSNGTVASPSLLGSNVSALPAQPTNLSTQDRSSGISSALLAVILVIVGLSVAGLLLLSLVLFYRRRAKRVHEHEKAVQELAYVEDDLKAGQVEKGLP